MSQTDSETSKEVHFRPPSKQDGAGILKLVHDLGVLDSNSAYAYMLIGEHHADSSVVAEIDGRLVGFITAYILPRHPDIVFVWQVGVSKDGRGYGLATRMLFEILKRPACFDVHYLDTTIGPSNEPSQALFRGLARRLDTYVEERELFGSDLFGDFDDEEHESEILFRIGPFDAKTVRGALPE
ncbi:diaminobutyrate acetyltransferase [Salinisphaera sp.]|uniref:diaminobutyrate acetyltransferase n=1 Tax=Salinisphaera sp. TaxID=1914330 RepID=UPI002D7928A2|nr:diaminobutyrate acetyltransferase [Salinisphaera sp.]HET7314361.1 diaminobutyrate acetyltransferase [Salinisphaera sp.]